MNITRAAILEKIGHPLVVRDIEVPALLPGQVLVKILFSGVCRSQLMEINGGRGFDKWIPHLLGHEGSGIVMKIGENVTKVKKGDEVILGWIKGDGLDAPGAIYKFNGNDINSGRVTTFCNYSVVSESRLVLKPNDLPFDIAVLFGCALPTGAGMVLNELKPNIEDKVLIIGLGGIGLAALLTLTAIGVKNIIVIDKSNTKLRMALKMGAMHTIHSSVHIKEKLFELFIDGADICIESGGQISTIELGFALIKKNGGKLLFASHPNNEEQISISPHELISGKNIAGSWGGATKPDKDVPKMNLLFKNAKISLDYLLTKRYKIEEINLAFEDLESGKVFRPLIQMEH